MPWIPPLDPCHNLPVSCLVAILPVAVVFWALVVRKMRGYLASLLAMFMALLIAIVVYRMPVHLSLLSAVNGALYGLFPICWIVFTAVLLFNITVRSGQFEVIRGFMAGISADRRIQALLIAFSFGSFLEGTAGFGAPVAITASMLTALGFNPLYAAGLCLIANTAPVAFGSIGIPVTVAARVTSLPEQAISQMVGRTLPFLSALLPFYLVVLMAGFKKAREVMPAVLVSGLSFALIQLLTSNYLGPALPDVLAGIGSIISLLLLLRFWQPRSVWRFTHETGQVIVPGATSDRRRLVWALSPFIVLTLAIVMWGLPPVKVWLTGRGTYLAAAGTAILFAAIVSLTFSGLSLRQGMQVLKATVYQLRFPILSIAVVLAFAYIMRDSGITRTIARSLANTGVLFPFFAPILGWLGVFITGSDTSSNALFCNLQSATAVSIGVDPVVTVGANLSGGVIGKMISPQSIAVGAAAVGLVGAESELFRFTVKHSVILLFLICCIVLVQAYLFKWMIPVYIYHL